MRTFVPEKHSKYFEEFLKKKGITEVSASPYLQRSISIFEGTDAEGYPTSLNSSGVSPSLQGNINASRYHRGKGSRFRFESFRPTRPHDTLTSTLSTHTYFSTMTSEDLKAMGNHNLSNNHAGYTHRHPIGKNHSLQSKFFAQRGALEDLDRVVNEMASELDSEHLYFSNNNYQ